MQCSIQDVSLTVVPVEAVLTLITMLMFICCGTPIRDYSHANNNPAAADDDDTGDNSDDAEYHTLFVWG